MSDTTFGDIIDRCGIEAKDIVRAVPQFTLRQAQRMRHIGRALQSATPEMEEQLFKFLESKIDEQLAALEQAKRRLEEKRNARTLGRETGCLARPTETVAPHRGETHGREMAWAVRAVVGVSRDGAE